MSDKSHVGMYQCYYCMEDMGILLDKRLRNILPMKAGVLNFDPCPKCKELMDQGIILISIKNDTTKENMMEKLPNPYRTGAWCVVKEDALKGLINNEIFEWAKEHRFMFITDESWDFLQIPREEINNLTKEG